MHIIGIIWMAGTFTMIGVMIGLSVNPPEEKWDWFTFLGTIILLMLSWVGFLLFIQYAIDIYKENSSHE